MTFNPFALRREVKRLREEVVSLEHAIREADTWIKCKEGVPILYWWDEDTAPTFRAIVERITR